MAELYRKIADKVYEVNILDADDSTLERISAERAMGLSLVEMKMAQDYYKKLGRNPTDIELEAIAQSWSEHCCYKTSRKFLRPTVFNVEAPQSIDIISEDAGVVEFDDENAYVVALESHNHPSALDPYGGAATGIGGILRDVVCMGAKPICLIDPIFFGTLDYPGDELPAGTKHPSYLFRGVVKGIADYGNRVGIPTVAGQVSFHDSYTSNCLVNVGCIGIMKKSELIHSRAGAVGDIFVMVGGRTGHDGIHGVTFASDELREDSERSDRPAVQLGDPITKEPLIHACLEANSRGLLTGLKDFGGGGMSCVVGEMAHSSGFGARVDIDKVMLKVTNMAPWEIWVSESQERMLMTVKPENLEEVLAIFRMWDVEATVIGEVTDTKRMEVFYNNKKIYDMDLDFQTGAIEYDRDYEIVERKLNPESWEMPDDIGGMLIKLMADQQICSREWIIRQYDHEVEANTVLKPMQGVLFKQGPGDAPVIKPVEGSWKGLAVSADLNPYLTELDPYWGTASAVEESMRNVVAVGARPHSFADNPNFGNPEKKDRLGDFKLACDAMYKVANHFKVPFVSGNVSLYNEGPNGPVAPSTTVMCIGLMDDIRKAVSMDLKKSGNYIYIVGKTFRELGGSAYARHMGETGEFVPKVDVESLEKKIDALLDAMGRGLVRSCHDLSEGGLLVGLSEMCLAGDLGVELELGAVLSERMREDFILFSESNGRWLVEVEPEKASEFEELMKDVDFANIGTVNEERRIIVDDIVDVSIDRLREAWNETIPGFMGEIKQ